MKKTIFTLCLNLVVTLTFAQLNLVMNGGLEQYRYCPFATDQIKYAYFWNCIDTYWTPPPPPTMPSFEPFCVPEYLNFCAHLGEASVPLGYRYNHLTHQGFGMSQVMMYNADTTFNLERDYLQGNLSNTLIAGKQYCVTYFAVQVHGSAFNINNIGAYLDDGSIDTATHCAKPQTRYTPQVNYSSVISDTNSWTMIQGNFIANGTERFITIGNFFSTSSTIAIPTSFWRAAQLGNGIVSWYLIDDVSVIASDAVAYAGHDTAIHAGDTASIGVTENGDGMPCWWYTLGGTTAIDSGGTIKVHPATTTSYVVKMNLCGNITYDTVKVSVVPAGVASPRSAPREWKVWPNPVGDELNVSGAKDCVVELVDVVGRTVITSTPATEKTLIDVSKLPAGTYFVKVTEPVTGGCVTKRLVKD
jgi:hypothetical protein